MKKEKNEKRVETGEKVETMGRNQKIRTKRNGRKGKTLRKGIGAEKSL